MALEGSTAPGTTDRSGAPRLVVLRALGLGDLLTAVPALRALARAFPDHRRTVLTPAGLGGLVALVDAEAEVVDCDLRRAGAAAPVEQAGPDVGAALASADVAVNLHGRGPESTRLLLDGMPRRLIAFACPQIPETSGGPAWDDDEHEVARWCRLLTSAGVPADSTDLRIDDSTLGAATGTAGDTTLLHPGAASAARRWPAERWAAVARAERERGRTVVVSAGPGETALTAAIAAAVDLPEGAVRTPRDVLALAALVASVDRVACGDTGVAHLATALATPSVVLFGPVSPTRWGPPAGGPHLVLWHGGTADGDPHSERPDPTLLRISVTEVVTALGTVGGAHTPPVDQYTTTGPVEYDR